MVIIGLDCPGWPRSSWSCARRSVCMCVYNIGHETVMIFGEVDERRYTLFTFSDQESLECLLFDQSGGFHAPQKISTNTLAQRFCVFFSRRTTIYAASYAQSGVAQKLSAETLVLFFLSSKLFVGVKHDLRQRTKNACCLQQRYNTPSGQNIWPQNVFCLLPFFESIAVV